MPGHSAEKYINRLGSERAVSFRDEALDYRPVMNWRGQPASTSAATPRPRIDISTITAKLLAKLPPAPAPILIERRI